MEKRLLNFTKGVKWDDMRAPASGINPVGPANPPSIDTIDGSLLFRLGISSTSRGVLLNRDEVLPVEETVYVLVNKSVPPETIVSVTQF